jgi:hypothetical protein
MKIKHAFGITLGLVMLASPLAFADNVVVTPGGPAAAPAPAPAGSAVVVQPSAPAPAPGVAVDDPSHRSVVHADVSPPHSYMGTIAGSALLGGLTGALVGGAIYFLGDQTHAYNIGYWAAGGVLVGTGVGLAQIMVQEDRASRATALQSDPAPTYRLALYTTRF